MSEVTATGFVGVDLEFLERIVAGSAAKNCRKTALEGFLEMQRRPGLGDEIESLISAIPSATERKFYRSKLRV